MRWAVLGAAGGVAEERQAEVWDAQRCQAWLAERCVALRARCVLPLPSLGAMDAALEALLDAQGELAWCFPPSADEGEALLVGDGCGEAVAAEAARGRGAASLLHRRSGGDGGGAAAPALLCGGGGGAGGSDSHDGVRVLTLDAVAYAPSGMPLAQACGTLLAPALRRQAARAAELLASAGEGERTMEQVVARHFCPPGWPHTVTLLQSMAEPEAVSASLAAREERLRCHALLHLPMDRPLLRRSNALPDGAVGAGGAGGGSDSDKAAKGSGFSTRLVDPHAALGPSGVSGGSVHMVHGSYEYAHYMQDRFDDKGWGCAYRSLQTIHSWFRRQHYTSDSTPDHDLIQRTLVHAKDKPASFVGSKDWIGSTELMLVFDALLGVSCKTFCIPQGVDMWTDTQWARKLCAHFDTEGTPVMIGGGVLAYTCVGCHFNEQTGEVAYLILDPHYTGADEVAKATSGGWVGWKRGEDAKGGTGGLVFEKRAFYNLLAPLRPREV